jgi:hypothetical protein
MAKKRVTVGKTPQLTLNGRKVVDSWRRRSGTPRIV